MDKLLYQAFDRYTDKVLDNRPDPNRPPTQEQMNQSALDFTIEFQAEVRRKLWDMIKPKLSKDFCDLLLANMPHEFEPEPEEPIGQLIAPLELKQQYIKYFIEEASLSTIKRVLLPWVIEVLANMVGMKGSEVLQFGPVPFYVKQLGSNAAQRI